MADCESAPPSPSLGDGTLEQSLCNLVPRTFLFALGVGTRLESLQSSHPHRSARTGPIEYCDCTIHIYLGSASQRGY